MPITKVNWKYLEKRNHDVEANFSFVAVKSLFKDPLEKA